MDLIVFGIFLMLGGLAIRYLGQQIALRQIPIDCKLHKWGYWDIKGWLPTPYPVERLENARLRCQNCLLYPSNIQTKGPDYE